MTSKDVPSWRRVLTRFLTFVGGVTVLLLLLLLVGSILLARPEPVPRQVILELDLERPLPEHVPDDPIARVVRRDEPTLRDIVEALRRAEEDDRVVGLVARIGGNGLGGGQVEEIREAVRRFRASGKPAVLFSESFGEFGPGRGAYYLAAAFDEIHLQPSGDLGLAGMIAHAPFLSGTLEWVGVQPRMDHRYEYKDALNLLTESEMTEAHREALERLVVSTYENLVAGIAAGRGMNADQVRRLVDAGPYFGEEALQAGLVDRLSYRDEVFDSLRASFGGNAEFLFAQEYLRRAGRPHARGPAIALIYGTGAVTRGRSRVDPFGGGVTMGAETVTRAFRDAVEDDDVRAILFRVDSPGGSYVASDAIWRETLRAREAGKPVIVSMGNAAASGGYFVAMGADRIVAHPSTVTGSIGVVGGKMLVDELTDNLGVTWDDVQVGGNATMWSSLRDYSEAEWQRVQDLLDRIYDDFTAKVGRGRELSRDSVHALARGRIWTGADAQQIGLVDELGGFDTALRLARELAEIEPDAPVELRIYPRERSLLEVLLDGRRSSSYESRSLESLARAVLVTGELIDRSGLLGVLRPAGPLSTPFVPPFR